MANVWNVEINTLKESTRTTEWRKIGVNLVWSQVLEVKRKYKGFMTRHVVADNNHPECPDCHAFGGHWLSCKSANALAMRRTEKLQLKIKREKTLWLLPIKGYFTEKELLPYAAVMKSQGISILNPGERVNVPLLEFRKKDVLAAFKLAAKSAQTVDASTHGQEALGLCVLCGGAKWTHFVRNHEFIPSNKTMDNNHEHGVHS